jgi:hypothetical protein
LTDLGPIQDTNPGSPSAPFATAGERTAWATANLASLLPGRTTVWGPGNVEYLWNGPLATDWQGIRGPYLGSLTNPFPTLEALAAAYPPGSPNRELYASNPFNPIASGVPGIVKFVDTGTDWVVAQNQILANFRNFDGSPILDTTATALTPGVIAELWSSVDLPLWMFSSGSVVSFFCDAACSDSASTATAKLYAGISTIPLTDSISTCFLSMAQAITSVFRGLSVGGNSARCVSPNLVGMAGDRQNAGGWLGVNIGGYAATGTKARISYIAGAATNQIRAYSVVIKSGVC